jgi:hypothetical protein
MEPMNESKNIVANEFTQEELLNLERDATAHNFEPIAIQDDISQNLINSDYSLDIKKRLRILSNSSEGVSLTEILSKAINKSAESIIDLTEAVKRFSKKFNINELFLRTILAEDSIINLEKKSKIMVKKEYAYDIISMLKFLKINFRDWLTLRSVYLNLYESQLNEFKGSDLAAYGLQSTDTDYAQNDEIQFIIDKIKEENLPYLL